MQFGYMAKILLFIPLYCVWVMVTLAAALGIFQPLNLEFVGIVLYIALLFPPIWLFTKVLNAQPRWLQGVLADGKQAPATVQTLTDTGTRINNTALIKLKLQVNPPDEAPFEASVTKQVSVLSGFSGYSDGRTLQVKYDPNNKKHITLLDHSAVSSVQQHHHTSASSHADPELAPSERNESRPASADFAQDYNFTSKQQQKREYEERQRQHRQTQNHSQHQHQQHQPDGSNAAIAEELTRLSELHKSGDLDDAEYAAAKKKLLG